MLCLKAMKLGLISDTHGELHPRVHEFFANVDHIVHAGDVGGRDVLAELETIAPVTACRGNSDRGVLFDRLPDVGTLEIPGGLLAVTHKPPRGAPPFATLHADPAPSIIVFGHTHFPKVLDDAGILLINPGSALRGRGAPPTIALLEFKNGSAPDVNFYCLQSGALFPVSLTKRHTHGSSGEMKIPNLEKLDL